MKTTLYIVGTILIASLSAIGIYRYAPLSWLESAQKPVFGATITTINGSDTLSSSRTVINTNFSNLNSAKLEASDLAATTSLQQLATLAGLTTTGTITTGVWNATPVTVPFGGTGSTTLSSNQILLGNGTGIVRDVVGWGTSGQTLTSNGTTLAPTWQSGTFDQTLNYLLTGNWNFTGNTLLKTLIASSTIQINNGGSGISLTFPTSNSVGVLTNNGSGVLSWASVPIYSVVNSNSTSVAGSGQLFATSTKILSIPAGILTASSTISVLGNINCSTQSSQTCTFYLRDTGGTTFASCAVTSGAVSTNWVGTLSMFVSNQSSLSSQAGEASCLLSQQSGTVAVNSGALGSGNNTSTFNTANALNLVMVAQTSSDVTSAISNYSIVVKP